MVICELRCAAPNDFAMLVPTGRDDLEEDVFDASGTPKQWPDRPRVAFHVEKRRKAQKPHANVSLLVPGALVLDEKARAVLGDSCFNPANCLNSTAKARGAGSRKPQLLLTMVVCVQ